MKALAPAPGARWLRNEVDRLFDRIWDGEEPTSMGEWTPKVDVAESPEGLTAKLDVPGIEPKDIQVMLEHDVLTIKGEKKEEIEQKNERMLRVERSYGAFTRSLKLPVAVDPAKVTATFRNGVLTIVMAKAADAKGTTIPIKVI